MHSIEAFANELCQHPLVMTCPLDMTCLLVMT